MNSLAAVTWKDMMEWKYQHIAEEKKALITKFLGEVNAIARPLQQYNLQCVAFFRVYMYRYS